MSKKWFPKEFTVFEENLLVQLAEFANRNQLKPGEIIVTVHDPEGGNGIKFMYYAEKELA